VPIPNNHSVTEIYDLKAGFHPTQRTQRKTQRKLLRKKLSKQRNKTTQAKTNKRNASTANGAFNARIEPALFFTKPTQDCTQ